MRVADLQSLRPLTAARLPADLVLHRIQLPMPRSTSIVIGPVFLSPLGTLAYRYDLAAQPVGYFAWAAATAVYETLARRDGSRIALATVQARSLLTVRLNSSGLKIADLRPHSSDWPVLQSTRYSSTQALAADLLAQGFVGVVYHSAQQHGAECLALFGAANGAVSQIQSLPLFDAATKRLHRAVVDGARGSQLPII